MVGLESVYENSKEQSHTKRYLTLDHIEPIFAASSYRSKISILGFSTLGKPLYVYRNGTGPYKIMMWSQMHGNESTTTKALLDFFNYLETESGKKLTDKFTFSIIPMLNPDGAKRWTRNNANNIDLNRDAQNLFEIESQVLRACLDDFAPDLCFNLHDQRTIFGLEESRNPATLSFLAPSYDSEKNINETRRKAMEIIAYVNKRLQEFLPGKIGRFDDSFNLNCIGDTVQQLGIPTILIEAGHYPEDYQREITRKYVFWALILALEALNSESKIKVKNLEYFNIPENKVLFFDIIYKNIKINYEGKEIITNFATQFSEKIEDSALKFEGLIAQIGSLEGFSGHLEYDARYQLYTDSKGHTPRVGSKADFYIGNQRFVNGKLSK